MIGKEKNDQTNLFRGFLVMLAVIVGFSPYSSAQGQEKTIPNRQFVQAETTKAMLGLVEQKSSVTSQIISVDIQEKPLLEALKQVGSDLGLKVTYSKEVLPLDKKVSVQLKDVTANKVIYTLLKGTGLRYAVSESDHLVLFQKNEKQPIVKKHQLAQVSGTVTDAQSGETLPGVNILVKGTTTGASTNAQGSFELTIPSLQDTLIFTYIGYQRKEVPVNGQTEINVELNPQAIEGEEMVVVGYQVQQKATSTGSITSVEGAKVARTPALNVENSLVGQLPGLVAINNSGQPGSSGSTLQIRGSNTLGDNSPLVVIDGVTNRTGGLAHLNPNDIEDITVLKDASAAIYGSQAANGVILVTTKRGRKGEPQVSLSYNQGFTQPTRVPEMADAVTYAKMINEIDLYRNRDPRYSEEDLNKYQQGTNPWTHPNTDWYDAALKDVSLQNKINASVSGGSDRITYYLSVGSAREDGFFEDSGFKYSQYNFRTNINGKINDFIDLSVDLSGRREVQEAPIRPVGDTFRALMRGKPTLHAYWPNGLPGPDIEYGDNPVVTGTQATGYDRDKQDILQTNLKLEMDIPFVEGLMVETNLSFDKNYAFNKLWETPWHLYTWDYATYDENGDPVLTRAKRGLNEPQLTEEMNDGYQSTLNLLGRYELDLEDHVFSFLAGIERQDGESNFFSAYRQGFLTDQLDELAVGGDEQKDNSGNSFKNVRLNYFGRINYNYKEKYLVEFVGRYDGSYIFPEGDRFGFFPAISVGWRLSEENFWQDNLSFLEGFKLRASWGKTGNDRIEPYQFLTTYGFGNGYVRNVNDLEKSLIQTRIANPNVAWEVANQFNVGFDAEMLSGKLNVEADYFYYFRDKILWFRNASIPTTAGFTLPRENIGEVANRGVDGRVTYSDQFGDFRFDISANAGYAQNRIEYWDEAPGAPEWQQSTGHPMNTNLYYKTDGVFNNQEELDTYPHWPGARPGDIKFVDVNDDGTINGRDRVRIDKNSMPTFTGGLGLNAGYKNFDFSVLFQGAAGAVRYVFTESGEIGNFLQSYAEHRWTPDNPDTEHPRTYNRSDEYWAAFAGSANQNTYFLRDADYIRLKTLEIGYNLAPLLGTQLGLQNLRAYISGHNLFTVDKLKVLDPEASSSSGQYYPQKRVFNVGISLTF